MRLSHSLLLVFILMIPSFVQAQMYGYVDKDGVFHFSDSMADIPEDQRHEADYIHVPDKQVKRADSDVGEGVKMSGIHGAVDASAENPDTSIPTGKADIKEMGHLSELKRLNTRKANLDAEYAALVWEKQVLVDRGKTLTTASDVEIHNDKMKDLNARIAAFEEKRQAFKKDLDAFYAQTGP